ncbi:MAG: HPF/RaiA family ribosome-associated protein, partial [Chitinophagaceae bacterium]
NGTEIFTAPLIILLQEELKRFSSQITRLEVHFSDQDGNKDGQSDKRCMIEARLEGMNPIAVTNHANTFEQALEGSIEKLKTSLDTILGRLSNHQQQ